MKLSTGVLLFSIAVPMAALGQPFPDMDVANARLQAVVQQREELANKLAVTAAELYLEQRRSAERAARVTELEKQLEAAKAAKDDGKQ